MIGNIRAWYIVIIIIGIKCDAKVSLSYVAFFSKLLVYYAHPSASA